MKYAVIRLGGRQFTVSEGQSFKIEKQDSLDVDVLSYNDGSKVFFGEPILKDVKVELEKVEDKSDKKIKVVKFKAKSRYRRQVGHRQPISILKVKSISK